MEKNLLFNILLFSLVMCCIQILAGCSTPALIIHRTVVKPAEIKGTIKAEKEVSIIKTDEMEKFEVYYQGMKLKKNNKDTSAVIKFFPDRNEFTYRIIPDTIIKWDTIRIDTNPIIIRGEEDWEKGIWIAGTLLINLVVYFAGKEIKKRKLQNKRLDELP